MDLYNVPLDLYLQATLFYPKYPATLLPRINPCILTRQKPISHIAPKLLFSQTYTKMRSEYNTNDSTIVAPLHRSKYRRTLKKLFPEIRPSKTSRSTRRQILQELQRSLNRKSIKNISSHQQLPNVTFLLFVSSLFYFAKNYTIVIEIILFTMFI